MVERIGMQTEEQCGLLEGENHDAFTLSGFTNVVKQKLPYSFFSLTMSAVVRFQALRTHPHPMLPHVHLHPSQVLLQEPLAAPVALIDPVFDGPLGEVEREHV